MNRPVLVHVPAMPEGSEAPLLVVLHGAGSTAARFEAKTGFDQLADEDRFIVVYPDAIAIGSSTTWNAGRCCPPASAARVDDVAFVVALLERLETTYRVDVRRVYAVGHSNGAMLAQRLGCEESLLFAAVASVAGSLELPGCVPRRAVAMLEIHGTADRQVPMSAALAAVGVWRRADRCATEHDVTVAWSFLSSHTRAA
jgi:polyhydroxybutyrate depolymerase